MDSAAWQDKRREWYDGWVTMHRRAPVCLVCGQRWSLRSGQLHHVTYMRLGAEEQDDLIPLCARHHAQLHEVWDRFSHWRRLGRAAATVGILEMLRQRGELAAEVAS